MRHLGLEVHQGVVRDEKRASCDAWLHISSSCARVARAGVTLEQRRVATVERDD